MKSVIFLLYCFFCFCFLKKGHSSTPIFSLILASSHPLASSPLSHNSYQPERVKAITCFLQGLWSQLTIYFQTDAPAMSEVAWHTRRKMRSSHFRTRAHRCPQLGSVTVILVGERLCHPSLPESTANSQLPATDGSGIIMFQTSNREHYLSLLFVSMSQKKNWNVWLYFS